MTGISRRRRAPKVAGAMAVGRTSTLALAGLGSPVAAQEPAVDVHCRLSPGVDPIPTYRLTVSDFPPNDSLRGFALARYETETRVIDSIPISTDPTGAGTTLEAAGLAPPVHIAVAVYHDTNHDTVWDPDVDDTVYRGDGPFTACPGSATLTPK
jgi:hypothetical protein